jgi:hypothetical protein
LLLEQEGGKFKVRRAEGKAGDEDDRMMREAEERERVHEGETESVGDEGAMVDELKALGRMRLGIEDWLIWLIRLGGRCWDEWG